MHSYLPDVRDVQGNPETWSPECDKYIDFRERYFARGDVAEHGILRIGDREYSSRESSFWRDAVDTGIHPSGLLELNPTWHVSIDDPAGDIDLELQIVRVQWSEWRQGPSGRVTTSHEDVLPTEQLLPNRESHDCEVDVSSVLGHFVEDDDGKSRHVYFVGIYDEFEWDSSVPLTPACRRGLTFTLYEGGDHRPARALFSGSTMAETIETGQTWLGAFTFDEAPAQLSRGPQLSARLTHRTPLVDYQFDVQIRGVASPSGVLPHPNLTDCDPTKDAPSSPADVNCDGSVRIAVVGDSYISGEGAFQYVRPSETSAQECHRAETSWAARLARELSGRTSMTSDTGDDYFAFLACSGATVGSAFTGQNGERGQISRLEEVNDRKAIDIVFVSIGGNDAGFSNRIQDCLLGSFYNIHGCNHGSRKDVAVAGHNARVAYAAIQAVAPNAVIVAVNYPVGVSKEHGCDELRFSHAFPRAITTIGSGHNFSISRSEREGLEDFAQLLNQELKEAASETGVFQIDLSGQFNGHAVCSDQPYLIGLVSPGPDGVSVDPAGLIGPESFHPNVAGHQELYDHVAGELSRTIDHHWSELLVRSRPTIPEAVSIGDLLEPFGARLEPTGLGPLLWGDDAQVSGHVEPNQNVGTFLQSAPQKLGVLRSDSNGRLNGSVQIPDGLYPGEHRLTLINEATGELYGITLITVEAPERCTSPVVDVDQDGLDDSCDGNLQDGPAGDLDQDGLTNDTDNCPLVPNSDQQQSSVDEHVGAACDSTQRGSLEEFTREPSQSPVPIFCNDLEVTVNLALGETPTEGDDVIRGTTGNDIIDALGGNDIICALQGDDIIDAGDGFDKVFAGQGNDTVLGGVGNDLLIGGAGEDEISGGSGNDRIQGGDGADSLEGDNGKDRIAGGNGNDIIRGGKFADRLFGNLGRDQLFGDEGDDVLRGGAWQDIMNGGAGANDGCTLNDPGGLFETRINCESGVFGR